MAFKALFQTGTNGRSTAQWLPTTDRMCPSAMISPPENVLINQQGTDG